MSSDSNSAEIPERNTPAKSEAWRTSRSRLMAQLEASIEVSRKALLAMDLTGIEGQTQEQEVLIRRMDELMREGLRIRASQYFSTEDGAAPMALLPLEKEVRGHAVVIQNAARLQSALLIRAQHKLRLLSSLLAGPSLTYYPFAATAVPGRQTRIMNFATDTGQSANAKGLAGKRI